MVIKLILGSIVLAVGLYIVCSPFDYPEYVVFGYWRRIIGWLFTIFGIIIIL